MLNVQKLNNLVNQIAHQLPKNKLRRYQVGLVVFGSHSFKSLNAAGRPLYKELSKVLQAISRDYPELEVVIVGDCWFASAAMIEVVSEPELFCSEPKPTNAFRYRLAQCLLRRLAATTTP